MRVTHVITRLIVGGAQENTLASVLGLRATTDWQVNLISGPTTGPEGSLESWVAATPNLLSIVPELVRPVAPWKDILAWRQLTRLFRSQRPHLVHTHSGKAGILGRLAARRARVPVVVHTIHGPSFGRFQGSLANGFFQAAERFAGRYTTHFITVADAMTKLYLAAGIGRPEQYTRIVSGFNLEPYLTATNDLEWRARWGIRPQDFVIGKIARLFKLKGHEDLIAAAPRIARHCPAVKFLLVGDGAWRDRLERKAREVGLQKHFVFTGLVAPETVPRFIGIMDLVIQLSLREGLPRALPQALAAARPIIAYDCDGAREVCLDNETGFLLAAGDWAGLIDRVQRLARDAALRQRLGQRGQTLVQQWFPVEKMVADLDALYHRLLPS